MLDYFKAVGIRVETETMHSAQSRTSRPATIVPKKKPAFNPLWIGTGIFVCACMSIMLLSVLGISVYSIFPQLRTAQVETVPTATGIASTDLPAIPIVQESALGVLRFQDGAALADQITISANLAPLPKNTQYEAWLIDDSGEQSRSIGILTADDKGTYNLTFVDPQSRNLLADFSRMEITVEPSPDNNPNPSSEVAYSSGIPGRALAHIRHLIVTTVETPNQVGVLYGMKNSATLINQNAEAMLAAYEAGKQKEIRSNAEALINLVVGNQDSSYVDWDGDGTLNDPGDGFGVLVNGDQTGYVGGMHHHSSFSAAADDSTLEIRMHDEHVEVSIHNIEGWAIELRDIAKRIAQAPDGVNIEADVRTAVSLANQILNGLDINGNELIEPIEGEGGALTAYQHAYYMADMPILPGKDQTPPTDK